jgi:hypothetical protein
VQDLFAGMGAQIKVPKSDDRLQTSIPNLDLFASLWAWIKMPEAPLECDIGIRFLKHGLEFCGKRQMLDCPLTCAFRNETQILGNFSKSWNVLLTKNRNVNLRN